MRPATGGAIENQAALRTRSAAREGGRIRLPSKRQASHAIRLRRNDDDFPVIQKRRQFFYLPLKT